ncbi:MAG: hypothetical protein LBK08_05865 [Treponema sp.]|jgi:hypothetical protein|nr:hypothetical protein [Treponema sp.]
MPGTADWSCRPVTVDGVHYPSTLEAARALAPDPSKHVSVYAALRRALARGEKVFMGHAVSYAPVAAKNGPCFGEPASSRRAERKPGSGPLLRYPPFESPLCRGINRYH